MFFCVLTTKCKKLTEPAFVMPSTTEMNSKGTYVEKDLPLQNNLAAQDQGPIDPFADPVTVGCPNNDLPCPIGPFDKFVVVCQMMWFFLSQTLQQA